MKKTNQKNDDELGGSLSSFDLLLQCNALNPKPKD
jgi:hypothetical protein